MSWDLFIASALGAGVGSGLGALLFDRLGIKSSGRRGSILACAGLIGASFGYAFILPPLQALRFAGEMREETSTRFKAELGNDRLAGIFVEAMDPLFHDPKFRAQMLRESTPADLGKKGVGRLSAPELERLFALRASLAEHSPALCSKLWNGGATARDLAEVVAKLPERDARDFYQLYAHAAKLDVDDEPPRVVRADEANSAFEAFFETLPLHEHAVVQRTIDAGQKCTSEDACATLGIFTKQMSSMPDAGGDVLRRILLSPWLKQQPDPPGEIRRLTRACEAKDMVACERLGTLYRVGGNGLAQDRAKGAELYGRACDGGNITACVDLGAALLASRPPEHERGIALLWRGCTDADVSGCTVLGVLYAQGVDLPKDSKKAADLYRKACDGHDVSGCRNLGVSYFEGAGVRVDFEKAAALFRDVCDAGDPLSCADLAGSYEAGRGVERSPLAAITLYSKACRAGIQGACVGLARIQAPEPRPSTPSN